VHFRVVFGIIAYSFGHFCFFSYLCSRENDEETNISLDFVGSIPANAGIVVASYS
jgi:hypothetical protein